MKKNLLLAGLLTTFSLVAKSQVGINTTNPQGVFNIDGLKNNPTTGVPTAVQAKDDLVMTSNGNLGLGLTAPGTTLDVNGAITNRETALAVAANAVTIPTNVSLVRLTGAATANVAISAFAAPNPGQRLIVYNNTTGGFGATLDGVTIPNGKALEFVFSNSLWRSTDGGGSAAVSPVNIYTADGTLAGNRVVTTAGNSLSFTNGANSAGIKTTGTEGSVSATGSSRGSFVATGGTAVLNMFADNNGKALVTSSGNSTGLDMGSATATPVNILTNNTSRITVNSVGNVGVNTPTPGTTLDVNGAITNRETALAVAGNTVTIPANVSQVQLTGAATANVAISAFAAPNPGQRLIVYNNTTGGFGATLDGTTVANGEALEFVFSNSLWRSTDGGTVGATPVNIYTANGTLTGNRTVTQGANTLAFTGTQTNAFSVDGNTFSVDAANDRVGLGTTTPDTKLTISTPDNSFGFHQTNGVVSLKSYIGGGVVSVGTTTANDLRFTTNNTQKMTINPAGNVGVGTVTPTNKLVVAGSNAQPSALGTATTNATLRVDGNSNHALDFGTYANFPYGSYISSQNKTSATGLPLVLNPVGGNVGVGTNAPDNSALLDLTATNRGFLLPRVSLTSMTDGSTIPSPAKALIVYNSNTGLSPYGEGLYYNSGTAAAPSWSKLAPQTTDYQLLGVFTDTATFPVDQLATGNGVIINNLNLGLSVSVTIPANSTAKIVVDYNVPVGTTNTASNELGYYGIRFLRNGGEEPAGSRKYTIPEGNNGSQMVSTVGKYSETYNNTSASPVLITYTLNGYVESTNHPVRFNMWAASGQNFNWGVGSISATAFVKDN